MFQVTTQERYSSGRTVRTRPSLWAACPVEGCGFLFRGTESAALHLVMAAGDDHLAWKAENLSEIHTLQNTSKLTAEAVRLAEAHNEGSGPKA